MWTVYQKYYNCTECLEVMVSKKLSFKILCFFAVTIELVFCMYTGLKLNCVYRIEIELNFAGHLALQGWHMQRDD